MHALRRGSLGATGPLRRRMTVASAVLDVPKLKNVGPEPKPFTVADGQTSDVLSAAVPALFSLGAGVFVAGYKTEWVQDDPAKYSVYRKDGKMLVETSTKLASFKRPEKTLVLYEFESCPFCAKVRDALAILDLDVLVYPCPKEGTTWRPKAIELGGKKQFPLLVDPNTDKIMYESDDIVRYLFESYGDGQVPLVLRLGSFTTMAIGLGTSVRAGRGSTAKPSKKPEQPLIFWGYEASPFAKVVREVLCELELPYVSRATARGSGKRQTLVDKVGHFQSPFLEDPNTGSCLFESAAIKEYLIKTYGA